MRVYELAKQINLTSRALLNILKELKVKAKSHMSTLSTEDIQKVKSYIEKQKEETRKSEIKRREIHRQKIKGGAKPPAHILKPPHKRGKEKFKRPAANPVEVKKKLKQTLARIEKGVKKVKKKKRKMPGVEEKEENIINVQEFIPVTELAKMLNIHPNNVILKCLEIGFPVTLNQRLDFDTISLIAEEFGYKARLMKEYEVESIITKGEEYSEYKEKPPIVTVMGHVDHGKTTLLDRIRETNVVATEKGGITEKIGAYRVEFKNKIITFIDTPGHKAFTAMRARGAKVTDIVILVVAANDGVMPQTLEAIDHAHAGGTPIIVAINKIDLPDANAEKVKRQLADKNLLAQEYGGDIIAVELSARTGEGIDELLEAIVLLSEDLKLKAPYKGLAKGVILEAKKERGRGNIVTVIIQSGTLNIGDPFIAGRVSGKVKALFDEWRNRLNAATPGIAVQILGFSEPPNVGDTFIVVKDDRKAREISKKREIAARSQEQKKISAFGLKEFQEEMKKGEIKELKIVMKGDDAGAVEALADVLSGLSTDEVIVNIIHKGIGDITENDVLLASASKAISVGYKVRAEQKAREISKAEGVEIRLYSIIYEATDDIRLAMTGLLEPEREEVEIGKAVIRTLFKVPKLGFIAGSYVETGKMIRGAKAKVSRNDEVVFETEITSLKRFKEDVKEVEAGFECGIGLGVSKNLKEGDAIIAYEIVERERTL